MNNNNQPRKNNNMNKTSKALSMIKNLKAEITPTIHKYTPSSQPAPIKAANNSSWNTKKIRIVKPLASAGSVSFTAGEVVTELFGANLDCSFFIEQLSVWNLGTGTATASSIKLTEASGLADSFPVTLEDFGTVDRPAAVGLNIPRALASKYVSTSSSSTASLFTLSQVVTFSSVTTASTIVADLWVVYQN